MVYKAGNLEFPLFSRIVGNDGEGIAVLKGEFSAPSLSKYFHFVHLVEGYTILSLLFYFPAVCRCWITWNLPHFNIRNGSDSLPGSCAGYSRS